MRLFKNLAKGSAILACFAIFSSSASSTFFDDDHFYWPHCFKDISSNGNLSAYHFGLAEMKFNHKNYHLHMKSEREYIRNSSCDKYSEHHLPGHYFCFPRHWGLECHYQVWAKDCDNSHDERAKLHGNNHKALKDNDNGNEEE